MGPGHRADQAAGRRGFAGGAGETYAFTPEIGEDAAYRVWAESPLAACVAVDAAGAILDTPIT